MMPEETTALFPDATPEKRAELLMKAGRISVEDMSYIIAHIRAHGEQCARIVERIESEDRRKMAAAIRNLNEGKS